jgi:hypothetical protein
MVRQLDLQPSLLHSLQVLTIGQYLIIHLKNIYEKCPTKNRTNNNVKYTLKIRKLVKNGHVTCTHWVKVWLGRQKE